MGQKEEMRLLEGKGHGGFGEGMRCVRNTWAHLLIAHLPIGLVPKAEHLPHHDPKAPHVAGCGEDPVGNGFGGCPTDGDLSSLIGHVGQKADVFQGTEGHGKLLCPHKHASCTLYILTIRTAGKCVCVNVYVISTRL